MSVPHRSFTVEVADPGRHAPNVLAAATVAATTECAQSFLSPSIANLGNRGIRTAAKRLRTWFERVDAPTEDLPVIASLMERAGTGGALFRNLYRDFLSECVALFEHVATERHVHALEQGRDLFASSALLWTQAAELITRAGVETAPDHLSEASELLDRIATIETTAMTTLRTLLP